VLDADERLGHALAVAYRYLNRRERTVSETHAHLVDRAIEPGAASGAVQALIDQGYLDDSRFARVFVQDKRELEHWGSERIKRALLMRGIDRDLIETTLAAGESSDGEPPESELDRAVVLLRRRFPAPPRDRRERERALGVLVRKGYDSELALDALSAYGRERA
jgi:regulatory protein